MRKLTVRLDDEEAEQFGQLCEDHGLTIQGCIRALVRLMTEHEDPSAVITEARRLDAEARSRRADPAP